MAVKKARGKPKKATKAKTETTDKNPVGQPTKYRKEYCQQLINWMSEGMSYETFGVSIGVSHQTLYDWEKRHEEYLEAKKLALAECQVFWEKEGIKGMKAKNFNAGIWIYNMKNRFRKTETFGNDPDNNKEMKITFTSGPRSKKNESND